MDRKAPLPIYPDAPGEYNPRWAAGLIRALDQLNSLLRNPGEGRMTKLVVTNMPTSDYGLEAGTLFRQGNQVFISLLDRPIPSGLSATGSVGTVTVTTSP